jgi:hypothetical protein
MEVEDIKQKVFDAKRADVLKADAKRWRCM